MSVKEITYFSDVLCIWAYVAQARIDAVKEKFGNTVQIKHHFCSVFADTARKIPLSWGKHDGYEKFNARSGTCACGERSEEFTTPERYVLLNRHRKSP